MCEFRGMAHTVNAIACAEYRERLPANIGDRNRPLKHIRRTKIVPFPSSDCRSWKSRAELASAALVLTTAIWQERSRSLAQQGTQGVGADLFRIARRSRPLNRLQPYRIGYSTPLMDAYHHDPTVPTTCELISRGQGAFVMIGY
jgi:hypothetical protein